MLQVPALALALLLLQNAEAAAQERAKIEIVPNIPHTLGIQAVAVSADGTRVLSSGGDGSVKLWDAATGRLLRTFEGHSRDVRSVAFSPDGRRVLSGSDNTLKLWDAATGRLIHTFAGHRYRVTSVAFSPDGTRVLSGSGDKTIKLWNADTGQLTLTFVGHSDEVTAVAFSPDERQVLSGSGDKTLRLWDAASGQLIHTLGGYANWLFAVAFSSDGTRLVSVTDTRALKVWDAASGQLIGSFEGQSRSALPVALSTDGARLVTGPGGVPSLAGRTFRLWDTASGQVLHSFDAEHSSRTNAYISAVTFSPDGSRLITGGDDNTLKLWDAASGQLIRTFEGHAASVSAAAFSPPGTQIVSGSDDKTLKLWDAAKGELIRTFVGHSHWVRPVLFSPDGARLLSGSVDKTVRLWDAESGQSVRTFEGHTSHLQSVAFSPDGTRFLSSGADNTLRLWDVASGELIRTLRGHSDRVVSATFSPDGTRLVSGSWDKTIKVWDASEGKSIRTFEGHSGWVQSVTFSPDGTRLLSGGSDNTVKLWDAASGQLLRTLTGHSRPVASVAFSPDGTRLVSGSWDKTIKVWDASEEKSILTFEGHSGWVQAVTFSSDGTRVLSGSSDTTVRIWDVETGALRATLLAAPSGEWLAITPEGFFNASAKGAEMLGVVRGLEVYSIDQFYQTLYRPDLVREKLAGDPNGKMREAAARLDLAALLDSGRVPEIVITSHKAQDLSRVDLVTVEAQLADQGGGIGRAEWRINGITVGVVEKAVAAAGQPIALKQAMALDPGENTIELTAYNGVNLVASVPARAKITWTGTEPTTPPRLYVLVVGINDYLDASLKLTYAVPDAKTLAAALKQAGHDHYEDVIVTHVLDRDATATKLDQVFTDLATKVRPRDVFLFFAAGHGKTLDGRYYFLPQDLRYHTDQSLVRDAIGQDKLQAWFARILAKKAVLMFDTCEAGSLTERGKTRGGLEQKAAVGRLIQATGRATLTASSATQEAYEGHGGHGVFTFALLDALARGDLNSNGLVELTELIQHVDGLVPAITEKRWGARQFPQMDAYGANFPLARQVEALAPAHDDAIIIPVKPTHVSPELLQIFKEAGGNSAVVQQLPPFTTVTLVKIEPGWVLIARDGKLLGYAADAKLHKLN
jgi:WD40 repeat protein